jgi:4,5-DOPA dioxygenase extradiol
MSARPLPPLFVSHGSPAMVITPGPARDFLAGLGKAYETAHGRPKAILSVSAHWETAQPAVSTAVKPETIHDFHGFPEELYRIRYPAPGAPAVANRAADLIARAGLPVQRDPTRGLDHGAWSPLFLMWPDADIPVAQVAVQPEAGPEHHIRLGAALAPLAQEGVLVMGSGSATHNLRDTFDRIRGGNTETPDWAGAFDRWLDETIAAGDGAALADYRRQAPGAVVAHPRDEHLLPLHAAFGAAGPGAHGRRLHGSFDFGSLSMGAWAFDPAA